MGQGSEGEGISAIIKTKRSKKTPRKKGFNFDDKSMDKITTALNSLLLLLKNRESLDFLIKEFKSKPEEIAGILGKINSLKGILSDADFDLNSILKKD